MDAKSVAAVYRAALDLVSQTRTAIRAYEYPKEFRARIEELSDGISLLRRNFLIQKKQGGLPEGKLAKAALSIANWIDSFDGADAELCEEIIELCPASAEDLDRIEEELKLSRRHILQQIISPPPGVEPLDTVGRQRDGYFEEMQEWSDEEAGESDLQELETKTKLDPPPEFDPNSDDWAVGTRFAKLIGEDPLRGVGNLATKRSRARDPATKMHKKDGCGFWNRDSSGDVFRLNVNSKGEVAYYLPMSQSYLDAET